MRRLLGKNRFGYSVIISENKYNNFIYYYHNVAIIGDDFIIR